MDFDTIKFEQSLTQLKNSQQSIQALSSWCTERRSHHKKIVTSWLNVLKQVKIDQRLVLFNLANDVIQNSKRKNYDFVGSWGTSLQRATTMVRDDPKVKQKIARIFKIWEERSIYNEEFLSDLNGLLNTVTAAKRLSAENNNGKGSGSTTVNDPTDPDDFQSSQLISHINGAVRLQEKTDKAFKLLSKAPDVDVETIRNSGKDREHVEGVQKEVTDSVSKLEHYIHAMKAEIKARNILIAALGQADEFYRGQRGDVKTVAIAYRNFGLRIKTMKKKLDELTTTLPSPMPSPDINAPSPPPDNDDLDLPEDSSAFSSFLNNGSLASSFLNSSSLPFDISDFERGDDNSSGDHQRNTIQVISDGYSGVMPPLPVPPVGGGDMFRNDFNNHHNNNSNTGYNPSTPAYGSGGYSGVPPPLAPPPMPPQMNEPEEYTPSSSWNAHTNSWSTGVVSGGNNGNAMPPMPVNKTMPASPPFFERKGSAPVPEYSEDPMVSTVNDVDQRAQHANPLLSKIESLVDVDHRNLISLTGSPGGGQGNSVTLLGNVGLPPMQKAGLLPTPPVMPQGAGLWQQPPPQGGNMGNNVSGGGDSDFRNAMQQQGIPPPPMPPSGYFGGPGNNSFDNFHMGMFNTPTKQAPQGKNGGGVSDNIDAVDMEMSDEEQDGGGGPPMDNNNGSGGVGGPPFMNFPPPGQMPQQQQQVQGGQWGGNGGGGPMGHNGGMHDSSPNGNNSPWNKPPGAFFAGAGGSPMFRPPPGGMNPNFRGGRGGFNRGGGGPQMFRGRGSPFRGGGGGNFRGNRGGHGMW